MIPALWALARPRLWPFVAGLPVLGWIWAHWDRALPATGVEALGAVVLAWTLLHVGTLWLNAALDRDEGEVLLGRAVPPPPGIVPLGHAALVGAVAVAWWAGPVALVCAAACAVLAVLYSHPRTVLKGHPVGGPAVNVLGYGLLSPLAGWSVVGVPVTPRTVALEALFGVGVFACFCVAQAFQGREDAARGYRTLVASRGPRVTLMWARVATGLVFVGLGGLAVVGWLPRPVLLGLPLAWRADAWLAAWAREPDGGDATWAVGYARRVFVALAAVVLLVGAAYVRASQRGEPVAGMGTAAGWPADRPRLPAAMIRHPPPRG